MYPRARASGFDGSVSLVWLRPIKSMKINPDFRYRSGSRFFTQKSPRGSKSLHKASQSDPKINEKSNPEPDLRYFRETLIFDDSTNIFENRWNWRPGAWRLQFTVSCSAQGPDSCSLWAPRGVAGAAGRSTAAGQDRWQVFRFLVAKLNCQIF